MSEDATSKKPQIAPDDIPIFELAREKLKCFHKEIQKLSNKKPDGQLNKFKLGFINQALEPLNRILGEDFRPFPDFTTFDVDASMPTASDVVMMLSQYEDALGRFFDAHHIFVIQDGKDSWGNPCKTREWNTDQPEDQRTKRPSSEDDDEEEYEEEDFDEDDHEDDEEENDDEDA